MAELRRGLYERLITEGLRAQLSELGGRHAVVQRPLDVADAADRMAWHIGRQVERALLDVPDKDRVTVAVAVARALLERLGDLAGTAAEDIPVDPGLVLHALLGRRPDDTPTSIESPLIPLLDTTLLTNAPGEPALARQLQSEIESADDIDLVMAFIRRSGIQPLAQALRRHCQAGGRLRILTTTFTDSTEPQALDLLQQLGAQIRVSYDTTGTRLHAKAWVFHRDSGWTTAYIGSSNLSRSAQVTGMEWNVRASNARNPGVIEKFAAVFDSYWSAGDFVVYRAEQFASERRSRVVHAVGPQLVLSPLEVRLHPFQERLVELITVARAQGHHRNLLVAATGTGKTVMAAVDYARLSAGVNRARLLFIAHREEILDQSLATFRHILRDVTFGEKWVGGAHPARFEHVFASIQSLHAADLALLAPDHFDVVILDEFHHAAAASYERVLRHLKPVELLGMTATPERSDGLPVLHWFGDRIAAELRVWDAIDRQYLVPFMYYGVHDGLDLREVPWRRGMGYDAASLTGVYTSSDAWARLVLKQLDDLVSVSTMRALGFCVSVEHARFMAGHFRRHGIPAVAVDGTSPPAQRADALRELASGEVRAVFSVDLFNEGLDVPTVDTLLLLRPTESPTLFLQQLGRGLRKAEGKAVCTVLDFVGLHRREFRFDLRYRALLGGTRRDVERAVQAQFPFLPVGCHMALDEKAKEIVLRSIREAIPSRWPAMTAELAALDRARPGLGLAAFLDETGLEAEDLYANNRSWSDLRIAAGLPVRAAGEHDKELLRGVGRLLHADDEERLDAYRTLAGARPRVDSLSERERRLVRMFVASCADQVISASTPLQGAVDLLWAHPRVRAEVGELVPVLAGRIDHVQPALTAHPACPLRIHARYSRIEILSAVGVGSGAKVAAWQSGVYDAGPAGADLLAFTLDKSSGGFSPTTRYRDYAISSHLIHWESQSATRADGSTGQRYQRHEQMGRSIFLFARLRQSDRAFWFLGPAVYRRHVGERPMGITWELEVPLSGDLHAAFAAAVA